MPRMVCLTNGFIYSDQKIADQNATRRMRRWYMPIFRQLVEWAVLNTGVILRQRPNGKLKWSSLHLKVELATELAFLGREEETSDSDSSESQDEDCVVSDKIRLQRNRCHTPCIRRKRVECRAHMQRKLTRYFCSVCKKGLCLGTCWTLYHSKRNYLYNDETSSAKVIHFEATD